MKIGPFGSQLKKSELRGSGLKVYGQENVLKEDFRIGDRFIDDAKFQSLRSVQLFPGDVVVTMMGSVGAAAVVPEGIPTGVMDSHLLRIQPDPSVIEPGFLARILRDSGEIKRQIQARSQGGIMSGLNAKIVRSLEVPIPPLAEQRRIAAILSSVDETIERTRAIVDQVRVVKLGLMQELFAPGLQGRRKRCSAWKTKSLADIATIVGGGTPSRRQNAYWNGDVQWATPTDVTGINGRFISMTASTITRLGLEESSARLLPPRSLLMTTRATIGACAINRVAMATNQGFQSLIPKPGTCVEFLYYLTQYHKRELERLASGSTFLEVSKRAVRACQVAVPPLSEQRRIGAVLASVDDVAEKTVATVRQSEVVKSALMSVLLTGELRVTPDPEPE